MKPKAEDWIESDKLVLLRGWARDGLTDAEIARKIGISRMTLHRWKNYSVIRDGEEVFPIAKALKLGKDVADNMVEDALFKEAMNGNTTAQIFWLKNRRPDKWRDRQEPEKEAPETVKVIFDV